MFAFKIIVGILLIALGCWQFYAARQSVKATQKTGNAETSRFLLLGIGSGFLYGIVFIIFGIAAFFVNF